MHLLQQLYLYKGWLHLEIDILIQI
jgi:hypothetical protein